MHSPSDAHLNVRIVTYNCARELIDIHAFADALFFPRRADDALLPDLLVLCLEEIAPIAQSFLGGSYLAPYTARFVKAVKQAAKNSADYDLVIAPNVGLTSLMLFAKSDVRARIQCLETAGVGFGRWDMGNKGAVGVRLGFDGQARVLTFVSAHLAAGEIKVERRNDDWKNTVRGLVFQPAKKGSVSPPSLGEHEPLLAPGSGGTPNSSESSSALFRASSPMFIAGDLNYRTSDLKPQPEDVKNFPQPTADPNSPQHWLRLRPKDQLDQERKAGKTLHGMDEAKIDFPPTYKYDTNRQAMNKPDGAEPDEYHWATHRWPGWCDRVLYSSFLSKESMMDISSYAALPLQPTSDHRPVALSFTLDMKALEGTSTVVQAPFEINKQWESDRAAARAKEIAVGYLAYLALTWEGRVLVGATVIGVLGGWLMMRSLM